MVNVKFIMKKVFLIFIKMLVLVGCTTRYPVPLPLVVPEQPLPVAGELVPMLPKIKVIDWQASLSPMVKQMLAVNSIDYGSVLLVNTLKNATNGSVQTGKATEALTRLVANNSSKFKLIRADKLNAARQTLGLSVDDSFESCSKAVGLARYLNAQYVLYSIASGDVKKTKLDLQLMLVQTGEIVWSYNGVAQYLHQPAFVVSAST